MTNWRIAVTGANGQAVEFTGRAGRSIAEAAEAAGYRLHVSCKGGGCGICHATLVAGSVDYGAPVSAARIAAYPPGTVFVCRARPTADLQLAVNWAWKVVDRTPLSRRRATRPPSDGTRPMHD